MTQCGQRMGDIVRPKVIPFVRQGSEFIEHPFRLPYAIRRTFHRHFFSPRRKPYSELFLDQLKVAIVMAEEDCGVCAFP